MHCVSTMCWGVCGGRETYIKKPGLNSQATEICETLRPFLLQITGKAHPLWHLGRPNEDKESPFLQVNDVDDKPSLET